MTVKIPTAFGVPGIGGPPDWTSVPPTGSYRLDDVRWNGATSRTFAGGASQNPSLRATQGVVAGQQFIYLSFRAPFVQELMDNNDFVYVGLQKTGSAEAMVIRIQVHSGFAHTGPPPDNNAPGKVFGVQVSTLQAGAWAISATPTWVNPVAVPPFLNAWVQGAAEFPVADPNNRWAIELKIPVTAAAHINDNAGPNLGTDFRMWYFIQGSVMNSPVLLADSGIPGNPTNQLNLQEGIYPLPGTWDQYQLTSGPATDGGVALSWGDVLVSNGYGTGYKIANGQVNTFIARPRNYTTTLIPIGAINATFRIANWGSVAMDPTQVNFSTGVWDFVPGNSEITPANSSIDIPTLAAGNNPPATNPISWPATMNLAAGKSLHQCVLATLSGTNLTFLNNSIYANMNYDHTSLLEREAEISIVGLKPFSPPPRDVYLAIEKVNMPRNAPGTNEGRFLDASMARLIKRGGPLAGKLKSAQANLSDAGDFGSSARLDGLLKGLRYTLADLEYRDIERGMAALNEFLSALNRWLTAVKQDEAAAKRLAAVFDALASWLTAPAQQAEATLGVLITQLSQWLSGLGNDPASLQLFPVVLRSFGVWLATLAGGDRFQAPVEGLSAWLLHGNRSPAQLASILAALRQLLAPISTKNPVLVGSIASFASGTAAWLKGNERLDVLVGALSDAGLTSDELDELFPTVRIHVYHDTGERVAASDGTSLPVLRTQSSFGVYTYHEGGLEGWQTSIQGAQRIADNLYLLAVPNNGMAKVKLRVQAVEKGDERIPDDPIKPCEPEGHGGWLALLLKLLRKLFGKK